MATTDKLTVAGIRFRTRADYEAALRDQKKIEAVKAKVDFDNPKQIYRLYAELQAGSYRFETQIGKDFDDEIYEKVEYFKRQGVPPNNAGIPLQEKAKGVHGGREGRSAEKRSTAKQKPTKQKPVKEKAPGKDNEGKRRASRVRLEDYDKEMQQEILAVLKKKERLRKLLVAAASLIAIGCFTYFGVYYYFSARTNAEYTELAALKGSDTLVTNKKKNDFALHKQTIKMPDVLDEYKTLYEKNKKLIGWLEIDDTIIDYPVMQTGDNEYYLDHNFNQEYDKNGSLFLDYNCNIYPRSTNLIIYGHHMKSGQMFGQLQKYAKESYGEKHSIIRFDSIYEEAEYQVMYVFRSQVYNEDEFVFKYYQFIDANSEEEFNSYMEEMAGLSLYDTGVTASYGDSLLTLSTCDNSQTDGRFVVVAKRIK
ncbi:MAG: class B sortase [Lachnospiraceae bacterium]|nr:class B sortase [Lachnospiraceae bacterium]